MGGVVSEVKVEEDALNAKKWPICCCVGLLMVLPVLVATQSVVCFCNGDHFCVKVSFIYCTQMVKWSSYHTEDFSALDYKLTNSFGYITLFYSVDN
jgi:hypothetical protein